MLDVNQLIEEARETMMREGTIMPKAYIQLDTTLLTLIFDLNDDRSIAAQSSIMARQAWERCKEHPGQKPLQACYYAEAWMAEEHGQTYHQKLNTKRDPRRKEIVSLEYWDSVERKIRGYVMPIIRNKKGVLLAVTAPSEPTTNAISHQFESFLEGMFDSQKPDEEVFARRKKQLQQRLAALPPEMRHQLNRYIQEHGLR